MPKKTEPVVLDKGDGPLRVDISEFPKIKTIDPNPISREGRWVELADCEIEVLKAVLDRDRTAREVHGGLKGLLSLSDQEGKVLLNFLRRI